jgi:hypothetical protein
VGELRLIGRPASPGVALSRLFVLAEKDGPAAAPPVGDPTSEALRLSAAIARAIGELEAVSQSVGEDGPLRKNPAYDQIIQGLSGVMSLTGDANLGPFRVGYPVCDTIGGITAAFAICAALYRRKETGEGQFIDVSMLEATLVTLGWPLSNWLIAGVEPRRMGNDNVTASPSGTFRTGAGLLNIAANKQEQFETLCEILGLQHLASDPRFAHRESRKASQSLPAPRSGRSAARRRQNPVPQARPLRGRRAKTCRTCSTPRGGCSPTSPRSRRTGRTSAR